MIDDPTNIKYINVHPIHLWSHLYLLYLYRTSSAKKGTMTLLPRGQIPRFPTMLLWRKGTKTLLVQILPTFIPARGPRVPTVTR